MRIVTPTLPSMERRLAGSWMVSYTVLLHISEYDYVFKVAQAISDNSKPFADTLKGELVEVGGDKVAVSLDLRHRELHRA